MRLIVDSTEPTRADTALAQLLQVTRSQAAKLLDDGLITGPEDNTLSKSSKVRDGDILHYTPTVASPQKKWDIPIIYEDEKVLVINKPAGLLMHARNKTDQENTVADIFADKLAGGDSARPGVVHRLDRGTSGVVLLAKNPDTLLYVQQQFANRTVRKEYIAISEGRFKNPEFTIDIPIGRSPKDPARFKPDSNGKAAVTKVTVLDELLYKNTDFSKISLQPKTGRTHQIRVHLRYLNNPILGDDFYGGKDYARLCLHSTRLTIAIAHNELKTFEAPLEPEWFGF